MTHCTRCILPGTYPGIRFDEKGVCIFCLRHRSRSFSAETHGSGYYNWCKLRWIIEGQKARSEKYDCVVPVSGGKDSTFVLYWCREIAKLSVIAVHVDTGFVSTQALENIQSAISALGVDYVNLELQDNLLKDLYRLFLTRTGDFCSPCTAALRAMTTHFALDNKVGLIVNGASPNEQFSESLAHFDNEYFLDVIDDEIPQEDLRPYILGRRQEVEYRRRRIRVLSLPFHMVWNEDKIAYLLERKLGWRPMSDHGDCLASPVKNYLWMRRWGFGKPTVKLSAMIREGYITRDEALRRLAEEETAGEPAILPYFLSELSVSREAFEAAAGVNVTRVIESYLRSRNGQESRESVNVRRLIRKVYDRDMVRWMFGHIIPPDPIYRAVRLVWPDLARALECSF